MNVVWLFVLGRGNEQIKMDYTFSLLTDYSNWIAKIYACIQVIVYINIYTYILTQIYELHIHIYRCLYVNVLEKVFETFIFVHIYLHTVSICNYKTFFLLIH